MKKIIIILMWLLSSCSINLDTKNIDKDLWKNNIEKENNIEEKIKKQEKEFISKFENNFEITSLSNKNGYKVKTSNNWEKYIIETSWNSINFNWKNIIYTKDNCKKETNTVCQYLNWSIRNFYISNSWTSYVTELQNYWDFDTKSDTMFDINWNIVSLNNLSDNSTSIYNDFGNFWFFLDTEMFRFWYRKKESLINILSDKNWWVELKNNWDFKYVEILNVDWKDILLKDEKTISFYNKNYNIYNEECYKWTVACELDKKFIKISNYKISENWNIIYCSDYWNISLNWKIIWKWICNDSIYSLWMTDNWDNYYYIDTTKEDYYIKTKNQEFWPYKENITGIKMSESWDLIIVSYKKDNAYYFDIFWNKKENKLSKIFTYWPFDDIYKPILSQKWNSFVIEYEKYKEAWRKTYININWQEIWESEFIDYIKLSNNEKSYSYYDKEKQAVIIINWLKTILSPGNLINYELHEDGNWFTYLIWEGYKNFRYKNK